MKLRLRFFGHATCYYCGKCEFKGKMVYIRGWFCNVEESCRFWLT
jgi:hypothetical protein